MTSSSHGAPISGTLASDSATIWLVDDSPLQAEVGRRGLAVRHRVTIYHRAAPMLEHLALGERPDILVVDWEMPEVSGLEACRFVREIADGAALPIIIVTANRGHQELLDALAAGANDFLRKPFDEAELNARVDALVRSKRLHEKLLLAQSALRAEASFREQFLAILAHDLRQPLNVFGLAAEMLGSAGTAQPVRENLAAKIVRASGRMTRMIDDLLDFSRSRPEGGMPLVARRVSLATIVDEVVGEIRVGHPLRTIDIETIGPCEGTWDPDRLAQVVSNLVENALAHSPPASAVKLTLSSSEGRIELAVANSGAPIDAELIPTIFDAFRKGDRARSSKGLGLGLYIVAQIAKAHGGSVSARSDQGQTRFEVSLPQETPSAA